MNVLSNCLLNSCSNSLISAVLNIGQRSLLLQWTAGGEERVYSTYGSPSVFIIQEQRQKLMDGRMLEAGADAEAAHWLAPQGLLSLAFLWNPGPFSQGGTTHCEVGPLINHQSRKSPHACPQASLVGHFLN